MATTFPANEYKGNNKDIYVFTIASSSTSGDIFLAKISLGKRQQITIVNNGAPDDIDVISYQVGETEAAASNSPRSKAVLLATNTDANVNKVTEVGSAELGVELNENTTGTIVVTISEHTIVKYQR